MDTRRWPPRSRWQILLVIIAAGLAHGGCLRSTFYLDDFTQVVETDAVDHGRWYTCHLRAFTYLTYWLTWRLCGMSAPAFHAGNLLLHAAVSLAVLGFAREFLTDAARLPAPRAARIALGAALLFAVHPLCSEIPNYTRARDIALVSGCALLAGWAVMRWRREGRWRWLGAAAAAILAGTFSKEVGCIVAGGTAAFVWFAASPRRASAAPSWARRAAVGAGVAVAVGGLGWMLARWFPPFARVYYTARDSLTGPRFGWHVLTQSRVFWRYVARVFLPLRLCSDHQIAWTVSTADLAAWVSLAAWLALGALVGVGLVRARALSPPRAAAALGAVALLDLLHRLANVTGELMVEYRMYPVMTALCVLLAWGWDELASRLTARGGRWRPVAAWAGVGVLAACIGLSARRTLDWRSADTLAANVVAQYPLQARARQEGQEADLRAHRWQAALDRQAAIRQALDGQAAFNQAQSRRRYDPALATLTRVSSEGNDAEALARLGRWREARAHLAWLRGRMEANDLQEKMYWALFYYASGRVHDAAGERADALADLRDSAEMIPDFDFPERERRRIEAEKAEGGGRKAEADGEGEAAGR